jgi:uncharacterized radical SAM protein YgiQ
VEEIARIRRDPEFSGVISDIGGPTANMYRMNCRRPEVRARCRRLSCIYPTVCKLLNIDHGPLIELMRQTREQLGIKHVFVASGIRMDLARRSRPYLDELARHHVGGRLKVAPEHSHPGVLELMKKPPIDEFDRFAEAFARVSRRAGKRQYLTAYFIAGHPGSDLEAMIHLAQYLKRTGHRPEQVQDFIPGPFDIATCMYYTGIDPMTGKSVYVARGGRERKLQRALLQFFLPENYYLVRDALESTGRTDLIGSGPDCLIPARPPRGAGKRSLRRPKSFSSPAAGYRPHRKSKR